MATLREQVGFTIRHLRKSKGWSQEVLAQATGKSVEMINRLERGRVGPSFETLADLARVFEVDVRDLFGIGPFAARTGRDDALIGLIERVSGLDAEDLAWVDDLVRVALARKVRAPSER